MLGVNPVYDAPAELGFAQALAQVPLSLHLSTRVDETAMQASFHAPALHVFETWSDARAFDGTATILQPQIKPLVAGLSDAEMVALFAGTADANANAKALVENFWRDRVGTDFDPAWTGWLRRGVVENTAAAQADVQLHGDFANRVPAPASQGRGIELLFRPDPFLRGGALANNGWLQELPRPMTRLVWDNAALIAPATAARLALSSEDVVEIALDGTTASLPLLVLPGQAEDCVTLSLGYGRAAIGKVGTGVGTNVYPLRRSACQWVAGPAELRATGTRRTLAMTQHHHDMAGRDIVRSEPLDRFLQRPNALAEPKDQP